MSVSRTPQKIEGTKSLQLHLSIGPSGLPISSDTLEFAFFVSNGYKRGCYALFQGLDL